MKLYYNKNSKDPTYYVQQTVRENGKSTTKNVQRLGKHSELLEIVPDPLKYCQDVVAEQTRAWKEGQGTITMSIRLDEKISQTDGPISRFSGLNVGYFFLQFVMQFLRLEEFFATVMQNHRVQFDCFEVARLLIYGRILDPDSKLATWHRAHRYFEAPEVEYQHILRFLEVLSEHETEFIEWLYRQSNRLLKRDTAVIFYDCSNYYFETELPDSDILDARTGEIVPGLRKYGVSKEHRPNPIVEMGLMLDRRGIPVSMCLHPGNTNEQTTAIPLEKQVVRMLDGDGFIYCADAGLGSTLIRNYNSLGGRAFIVTQSIKKLELRLQEAVFNDYGYRRLSNNEPLHVATLLGTDKSALKNLGLYDDKVYKVINADRPVDIGLREEKRCKNGKVKQVKVTGMLPQRIIVVFSRKTYEYQRAVRQRQIERAEHILKTKDPDEIKKGPNDVRRFLKRRVTNKNTGNAEDVVVDYVLDKEAIAAEEKYDGYYAIATNLDDSVKSIIEIAGQRYEIEECFRLLKTFFKARPVYLQKPERIHGHFLICYAALLVYRLLAVLLDDQGTHCTPTQLISTMQNMIVTNERGLVCEAHYGGSRTLDALMQLTSLELDQKYPKPAALHKMLKKILR